jgi:hypothetical protein
VKQSKFLLVLSIAAVSVFISPAAAQETMQGVVLREGTAIADLPVSLHRVTRDTAGVVGTTRTGPDGRFELSVPARDTAGFTVFFATAEYQGIRYFGAPLHDRPVTDPYAIEVFATEARRADAPPLPLQRDMVMIPDPLGSWEINEVVTIRNDGNRTLIAADGGATWWFDLPANARSFQVGDGTTPSEQIVRMGDRVLVTSPLVPGMQEVMVRYRLPPGESRLMVETDAPIDTFRIFVRLPAPSLEVRGLNQDDLVAVEGERFLRYAGGSLPAGATIDVSWRRTGPPVDPITAGVGIVAVLLVVGTAVAFRRSPRGSPPQAPN